jgi:hypothetical protein
MVYRGRIDHGVVVLEDDASLPEGTVVDIVPVGSNASADAEERLYRLADLATPSGIPDLAVNIDHYLYGHPRVDDAQS